MSHPLQHSEHQPMRLIPVLDLAHGCAVHARGGSREAYAPVRSVLAPEAAGDPLALVRAIRERLARPRRSGSGSRGELYVADLDAITGLPSQRALIRRIAGEGLEVLLDAGVATSEAAHGALRLGASRVIVGLETLRSFEDLREIVAACGPSRTIFSLDLRAGRAVADSSLSPESGPVALAERAVRAGVGAMIVLDLARVGTGQGLDLALLGALRGALGDVELVAGGGVRDSADLRRLAEVGCDAALVGTALHEGRIDLGDVGRGRGGSDEG